MASPLLSTAGSSASKAAAVLPKPAVHVCEQTWYNFTSPILTAGLAIPLNGVLSIREE